MKYVAGLDFGTSSLKTTILQADGMPVIEYNVEYLNRITADGGVEQNPQVWYMALIRALSDIESKSAVVTKDIVALCVTGQMQGLTLLNVDGRPVRDSILWNDSRCQNWVNRIAGEHGSMIMRVTHTRLDTGRTLPKIMWLREKEPKSWEETWKFIFPTNYINFKLTGNLAMDKNCASGSCLFDIQKKDWSDEILDAYNLDRSKFVQLIDTLELAGTITALSAKETGLKEGTPVIMGAGDTAMELFSVGVCSSDTVKIRLGSAGDITSVFTYDELKGKEKYYALTHVDKDKLIGGTYIKTCAQAVKWMRGMFFCELPATAESYKKIDQEGISVDVGSNGIIYHPYLMGECSPYYMSSLRAMFHGLSIDHKRGHIVRAVYEGISFALRNALNDEGTFDACDKIIAVGGGTKSKLWISILVDVLGRNVCVQKYGDSSYGAALIAGEGTGIWEATDLLNKYAKENIVYEPNMDNHDKYNQIYKQYKLLALQAVENA